MDVVIAEAAKADLASIGDFIRLDDPIRADTFVQELIDRCEELADAPRAYPLVTRYEDAGIRRRPYRGYLIFYRVGHNVIEVLHVLHGARDYEGLLFPEG